MAQATQHKAHEKSEAGEKEIAAEFKEVVNMSASEIEKWLKTDESKSVGQTKDGASESIGHQSGRHIIEIMHKKSYTDADLKHMKKVISYVRRHMAQGPEKDAETSNWRYSLKNWGHDPCK